MAQVKKLIFCLFILFFSLSLYSQTNSLLIHGLVKDSLTQDSLSYVAVYIKGTTHGAMTDEEGKFELNVKPGQQMIVSCIGYKDYSLTISSKTPKNLTILLVPSQYQLSEVLIKPKKEKYRKKGNPAVEFVEKIIKNKEKDDPYKKDYYSYQRYEKLTYGLNNFDSIQSQKWLFRKFGFLKNYVDTSEISHLPILTVATKESLQNTFFRKSPESLKSVVYAVKHDGIDEMLPEESMNELFSEAFKEVDIYKNDITLFFNKFVSPLSSIGPSFYKYYLLDTLNIDGVKCQDLGFVPHVSETFGFTGHMYVTLDSTYFVKKVILDIPKDINLNYIDKMVINQEFDRAEDGTRLLLLDDISIEFKIVNKVHGIYARRLNSYRQHSFEKPSDEAVFDQVQNVKTLDEAKYHDEKYWEENRHIAIREKENAVKKMLSTLREVPIFYYSEKVIGAIVDGYIPTAPEKSKVEIGPINTMLSVNSFEGLRMRLGGITSAYLSPHWFYSGFVAYGTKDQEFKYKGQIEYSFKEKKIESNEFPLHSLRASYTYDVDQLGQQYLFTNKDNIVLSLKRKKDDRITYLRKAELSYIHEFFSGFSYTASIRNKIEYGTDCVSFDLLENNSKRTLPHYMMTEGEIKLRYAPHEKFYQMKTRRIPITPEVPVFYLSHITAKKGFLGSDYNYNRTELGVEKRIWFSAFGYVQSYLKVGKVWDKVPFTMLAIPNANLSYTIQPQSYSLMNAVEFINDQYAEWDITYFLNGWIFNRIPLLKVLKWREVASFRGLYGSLSNKNIPQEGSNLFVFPQGTYKMGKTPYMEATVGIENILKLIRLDYVWRLTYRNHPHVNTRGVRVSVHVTF